MGFANLEKMMALPMAISNNAVNCDQDLNVPPANSVGTGIGHLHRTRIVRRAIGRQILVIAIDIFLCGLVLAASAALLDLLHISFSAFFPVLSLTAGLCVVIAQAISDNHLGVAGLRPRVGQFLIGPMIGTVTAAILWSARSSDPWIGFVWLLLPFLMLGRTTLLQTLMKVSGLWPLRVVVVGDGPLALSTRNVLNGKNGFKCVGARSQSLVMDSTALAPSLTTPQIADLYVMAREPGASTGYGEICALLRTGARVAVAGFDGGLPQDRCPVARRNNLVIRPISSRLHCLWSRGLKSMAEFLAVLLLIVLLAPAFAILALLVRLDGGPAFYSHSRIGKNGRSFGCLKFRSMAVDSDRLLAEALERDPLLAAEWAERRKLRHDPRVTWIGRILRKTSMDELPQLFNVLRGEMSLVGPRPIVMQEVERYGDQIGLYCAVRPGLTGLWQVSGRSDTSYEYRVGLDSLYVTQWTLWQDMTILARTVPAVLSGSGAT